MSSTTKRRADEGQILVVFAGGLVAVCLIAALVFDVGQNLLDRRTEQNVSDAASLAGARYVKGAPYTFHAGCSANHVGLDAVEAACEMAASHGFADGVNGRSVRVDIPPVAPSTKAGFPDHIQVTVRNTRPSFFMGVAGITQQQTGATAVATNDTDMSLPYSLLALNPHDCGANKISGSPGTIVSTNGTIHIDSDCTTNPGALQLSGNGVLTAPQCDVVGLINVSNNATNNCTEAPSGVLVFGDPLRNLDEPPPQPMPMPVQPLDAGPIPSGCPGGSSPASDASPKNCAFTGGPTAGHAYRLFPGNYPGGISTSKATLYLSPGIYFLGGGGLQIQSDGAVVSKALGDDTGRNATGGVLLFNTHDPLPTTGCTGAGCYGPITINGSPSSQPTLALLPIEGTDYDGMVIFVDREDAAAGIPDDLMLNGGDANLSVTGSIYAPSASFKFNGSESDTLSAQVICYDFTVTGSGAAFTIGYNPDDLFHVLGVGLVE